jgi:hypothetical protein
MSMDFPVPTAVGETYTNAAGITYKWDGTAWVAQGGAGGGGGGGTGPVDFPVDSVNGKTGNVVLNAVDVGAAPTVHTHVIADVTSLQAALDGKAPTAHTHTIADVTSLQTSLDSKAPLGIVSTADPDPAQGVEGTVWYKVL